MDAETKKARYRPDVEALLKQFQRYANPEASHEEYSLRYEFTFWPEEKQRLVLERMAGGEEFEVAFRAIARP